MLLYIDPGTGSMLFTILIGVFGAALYSLRMAYIKLRFVISGGRQKDISAEKLPIVIFSDDKRYWNVFSPICRELNERKKDVVYMTASPDDPALDNPYEHVKGEFIGEGNKAFARMNYLNAGLVLSTTPGLDVYQWKRSKNVDHYVHITHAPSDIIMYKMFGIDYYDAILLSGSFQVDQVRALEEKWGLPEKELKLVGLPYMDEMKKRLSMASGGHSDDHVRTVLLAPSWGKNAIFSIYGERMIEALLNTGYHLIIRPHPQSFSSEKELMDILMKKYPDSDRLEWNRDNDNFDCLMRADILISDFSGVIFEYALVFDKPVIYTDSEYDKGVYDAWWIDEPLWTYEVLPDLGEKLSEEALGSIGNLIDKCISEPKYAAGREKARKECWEHIGEGAEVAADFIIGKCEING